MATSFRQSGAARGARRTTTDAVAVRSSLAGRWLAASQVEPAGENLSPTWSAIIEEELDGAAVTQAGWVWADRPTAAPITAWRFADGSVVLREGFRWQATDTGLGTADGRVWVWSLGSPRGPSAGALRG